MRGTIAICLLAACGDDGYRTVDAALPDPCMPGMTFTGEYVDWDSSTSAFMGIPQATFTYRTDSAKTDVTAPNGRFDLMCIPAEDGFVDIMPMPGSDYVGGTVVASRVVLQSLPALSFRSFTTTRAAAFGFDAGLAHVLVRVHGGTNTVVSHPPAGIYKTFDGTTWNDGNTGDVIYLGNLPGTGTNLMAVTFMHGLGGIPLTPGAFTYVTIVAR